MAKFYPGQRVKSLATISQPWEAEGVIVRFFKDNLECEEGDGPAWLVDLPGQVGYLGKTTWVTLESYLVPLTDPLAEQFIERIKKLAREPAPALPDRVCVTNCLKEGE